jgi:hypothetical protein
MFPKVLQDLLTYADVTQLVEFLPSKQTVARSSRVIRSFQAYSSLLHFLKLKKCRNLHLLYNHVKLFLLPLRWLQMLLEKLIVNHALRLITESYHSGSEKWWLKASKPSRTPRVIGLYLRSRMEVCLRGRKGRFAKPLYPLNGTAGSNPVTSADLEDCYWRRAQYLRGLDQLIGSTPN